MKKSSRLELIILAVLLLGAMAGFVWMQFGLSKPKGPKPEVAIQDGKTLDFSPGVAVIKDDAKSQAALEKSLKEIDAAVKDVTFSPTTPAQKKAEPVPAPPKK